MEEEEHSLTFKVVTTVFMPKRGLRISVRDKDGNFIKTVIAYPQEFLWGLGQKVKTYSDIIQFESEGTAHFRFGTKTVEDSQEIKDSDQDKRQLQYHKQLQQQQQQYQQHHYNQGIYPNIPEMDN